MASADLNEAIINLNNATNAIAGEITELRNALAAGDPVTPAQLAQLDAIASTLQGLAADPANPVP